MIQDRQQMINALLSYYQNRIDLISNKKAQKLKEFLKKSDELKITKLKKEIGKSKI
jgi:hypothetical protein